MQRYAIRMARVPLEAAAIALGASPAGTQNQNQVSIVFERSLIYGPYCRMEAFAQPQDRGATIGPRFDYLALAPAAAAFATLFYSGPFMPWSAHRSFAPCNCRRDLDPGRGVCRAVSFRP